MLWQLAKIGLVIQVIGFIFILWSQRKAADQYAREMMVALAFIALGLGSLANISASIIPAVDGKFIARQSHFKGSTDDIVVRTSDGHDRIVDANINNLSACNIGSHVVKPSFSLDFLCDDQTLAPIKIAYYIGLVAASVLVFLGILFFIRCQKLLRTFK